MISKLVGQQDAPWYSWEISLSTVSRTEGTEPTAMTVREKQAGANTAETFGDFVPTIDVHALRRVRARPPQAFVNNNHDDLLPQLRSFSRSILSD